MYIAIEGLNPLMVMVTLYKPVIKGNMYGTCNIRNLLIKLQIIGVYIYIDIGRGGGCLFYLNSLMPNGHHDPLIQTCIKSYYVHIIRNLLIKFEDRR